MKKILRRSVEATNALPPAGDLPQNLTPPTPIKNLRRGEIRCCASPTSNSVAP